jgi:hypothetical protein
MRSLIVALALLLAPVALAQESAIGQSGEVRVPLTKYTAMLNQLDKELRPAPAAFAIGQSDVVVNISDDEDRITATVNVTVLLETFEDEWTLVPILPNGAALRRATVNGQPVQLVQGPDGLAWSTAEAGTVTMQLSYGVDARRFDAGFVLPVPVPRAAATALNLRLPATGVDLAVVPSADLRSVEEEGITRVTASVPATSSILVSWRTPSKRPYVISRALYSGELREKALVWTARFQVETFTGEQITLPLMPSSVTLNDIRVDGKPATVIEEEGRFATIVQEIGMHEVQVEFQVPVIVADGPPQATVNIPRIPVSRFDLVLPGKKEVNVSPRANVVTTQEDDITKATVFIPMRDSVVFTWTEAIPESLRAQVRANASLYHAVHAEEGVLHARATVVYEITHGETSLLALEIPDNTQVNRIVAPEGGVSDWAVAESETEGHKKINVFLDRAVTGQFVLEIAYERLLAERDQRSPPARHGGAALGPGTGAQAGDRGGGLQGRRKPAAGLRPQPDRHDRCPHIQVCRADGELARRSGGARTQARKVRRSGRHPDLPWRGDDQGFGDGRNRCQVRRHCGSEPACSRQRQHSRCFGSLAPFPVGAGGRRWPGDRHGVHPRNGGAIPHRGHLRAHHGQ